VRHEADTVGMGATIAMTQTVARRVPGIRLHGLPAFDV
jgi:hypothetical protein